MQDTLKLYTDGGSRGNPGPAAYAYIICKLDNSVVEKYGEYLGNTTNNQAEYKGLVAGLERAIALQFRDLQVYMDSELIIRQMIGKYKVKNKDLLPLFTRASMLAAKIEKISFTHVARTLNTQADAEVNRILDEAESR